MLLSSPLMEMAYVQYRSGGGGMKILPNFDFMLVL